MKTLLLPFVIIRNLIILLWLIFSGSLAVLARLVTFKSAAGLWVVKHIYCRGFFVLLGNRVTSSGLENIDISKTYVFTANHESHLDTQAIFLHYPKYLFFIAKKELKNVPVVGWVIWAMGMIFVDRKNPERAKESLSKAADMIRGGKNIISFPEGTRNKDGQLGRFKKGLFALALQAEVDVIPVTVLGAREAMPSGSFKLRSEPIHVHFSPAVSHAEFKDDPIRFANSVRDIVAKNRTELRHYLD